MCFGAIYLSTGMSCFYFDTARVKLSNHFIPTSTCQNAVTGTIRKLFINMKLFVLSLKQGTENVSHIDHGRNFVMESGGGAILNFNAGPPKN